MLRNAARISGSTLRCCSRFLFVYGQTLNHGFINYDDPIYVTDNPHVRNGLTPEGFIWAFTSAYDANWFPLTWLSHMLDCQLFGLNAGLHHLTNVVLHALNALLLFALLQRMTSARWCSAFVAFVFALHPLHVESVAWVAERKDVLSALFWFLTLWAYLNYIERRSPGRYLLIVLMFCCGLMSKPMIVTLPFVLLLLDVWPLRRKMAAGLLLEKLPLIALSIGASVVTYLVQRRGGAVLSIEQIPLASRIANAVISYVVYLVKFIWPTNLAVFYPHPIQLPAWQIIAASLALAGITALVLRGIARRPYLAVGWLWYMGTLVPVIGLVQVGAQARADRYTYIPMIGISIMLAWGGAEVFERRHWSKPAIAAVAAAACSAWLVVAWLNVTYWQNSIRLFQHAVDVTERNHVAHNNLGVALRQDGRAAEAVGEFRTALEIRPQDAEVQDNLGEALLTVGSVNEAIPPIQEALRLKPDFAKAHVDLGSAFMRSGRSDEAATQYRLAVELAPDNAEAQYGLGGVLLAQGRTQEAVPHLQAALPHLMDTVRAKPDDADGHYNLGRLFGILGRTDEAIAQFSETVRLRPDDAEAHFNLGVALAARERRQQAVDEFSTAVRLRPDYVRAHFNLGTTLAGLSRYDEAIGEFQEVLRLRPDFPDARRNLDYYATVRSRLR